MIVERPLSVMSSNFKFTNLLLIFSLSIKFTLVESYTLGVPFIKHHGERCDWRGQAEICDQSRGLGCSYDTGYCDCWDGRQVYSNKIHRCVGKASEECAYFDKQRLCTENSYCLEDRSLSPIPICVCLKGYFRTGEGACVKYSKHGETCDQSTTRLAMSTCEPDIGLECIDSRCACEPNHVYDGGRDICLAKAGFKCSRLLQNCVENADCSEKTWILDHDTRETKHMGYRCACKPGLKVTTDGHCASEYGGSCNKTSECFKGEGLTCLNGMCQCLPLSQVYDLRLRKCFNLVGTNCVGDRSLRRVRDVSKTTNLPKPTVATINTTAVKSTPVTTITKHTKAMTEYLKSTQSTVLSSSFSINPTKAARLEVSSKNTTSPVTPADTTSADEEMKPEAREQLSEPVPRFDEEYLEMVQSQMARSTDATECVTNAECVPVLQLPLRNEMNGSGVSTHHHCQCLPGSSETIIRTCLLDYGESCHSSSFNDVMQSRSQLAQIFVLDKEMTCNVFEGLLCHSDLGKCICADPTMMYDHEVKSCVVKVGTPCGKLRLGMLDLPEDLKDLIYIRCEKGTSCAEQDGSGGRGTCVRSTKRMGVGIEYPFSNNNRIKGGGMTWHSR